MLTLKCYDTRQFSDCHQVPNEHDFLGMMKLQPRIENQTTSNVTDSFLKKTTFSNLLDAIELIQTSSPIKKENTAFCIEDPISGQLIEMYELHFGSAHGQDNIKYLIESAIDLFYSENTVELVSFDPKSSLTDDNVPNELKTRHAFTVSEDYAAYTKALRRMTSDHAKHDVERQFGLSSQGVLVTCDTVDDFTLNGLAFSNIQETFLHCTRCIAKDYFDDYIIFRETLDN